MIGFPDPETFLEDHANGESCSKKVGDVAYQGNCHCGRYRFRLLHPLIQYVMACACSLCDKHGGLWLVPSQGSFVVLKDEGTLVTYRSTVGFIEFCSICGSCVKGEHSVGTMINTMFINVRTLFGLNPFELKMIQVENVGHIEQTLCSTKTTMYNAPAGITHLGSCHCARVKIALVVPLGNVEIKEDNCSICAHNAWVGAYPTKDQVMVFGKEFTRDYRYGRRYAGFPFCTVCGVHVFNNLYGPPQEVLDSIPPERKEMVMAMVRKNLNLQPVNIRALDNVNWEDLKLQRNDCGTDGYVLDP